MQRDVPGLSEGDLGGHGRRRDAHGVEHVGEGRRDGGLPRGAIDDRADRQEAEVSRLARQGVVHFGIDSMRPAPEGKVNFLVHKACLDLDITHIESLCNLESLLGKGQFTFIGLPMKWRGGTGSPIRAVAVFDL